MNQSMGPKGMKCLYLPDLLHLLKPGPGEGGGKGGLSASTDRAIYGGLGGRPRFDTWARRYTVQEGTRAVKMIHWKRETECNATNRENLGMGMTGALMYIQYFLWEWMGTIQRCMNSEWFGRDKKSQYLINPPGQLTVDVSLIGWIGNIIIS